MHWALAYFFAFDVSFGLVLLLTPMCERFAHAWGWLDAPDAERKQQAQAMPLLGGLAVFGAFALNMLLGYFVVLPLASRWLPEDLAVHVPGAWSVLPKVLVLIAGGAAMVGLGLYDDKRDLPPRAKFLGQVAIAALVWLAGMRVTLFVDNVVVSFVLTVGWIVAVTNALNFLDNMDGLCTGVGLVCALLFAFIAGIQDQYFICLLALALAGALLGFLPANFQPARIYLGDAGSHFIGFMLAVIPVMGTFYHEGTPTHLPVLIPLLVLAVPLFDMALVSWMRWRRGQSMAEGDTTHISHRLVRLGLPVSWAVVLIYLITLTLGLGATVLLWSELPAALIVLAQAGGILAIVTLLERLGAK
jgi:UDP-GlcNAc:undecaprenyl-phosphate GlcNAc-1-phosphate transferase